MIGGGDFSQNRIIPDIIRSLTLNKYLEIRNPKSTRPWQHVLEPLRGYIDLSIDLYKSQKNSGESFNFGPRNKENYSVIEIVKIIQMRVANLKIKVDKNKSKFGSGLLKLNCKEANNSCLYPYFNTKKV